MLELYLESLAKRVAAKEIKPSTLKDREWKTAFLRKNYSKHRLSSLTTLEINKILKHFTTRGKHRMAQSVRSILIDFFNEAIAAGYFPADKPNPAQVTRSPRVKVKRARMTLEVFLKALEWAKANLPPRAHLSMQLALVTAQRREDIVNLKLSRIESLEELDPDNSKKNQKKKDPPHSGIITIENVEYLAIRQNKTGNKLLIPLDLKMESINLSVRDAISQCRDNIVSEYAIHHNLSTGKIRRGQKISPLTASRGVSTSIAALNMDWGNSEPPTFHEIRSLSEREYSKQGVNTQYLLGHKHKRMTEVYHDARGHDWVKVPLSEGAR